MQADAKTARSEVRTRKKEREELLFQTGTSYRLMEGKEREEWRDTQQYDIDT